MCLILAPARVNNGNCYTSEKFVLNDHRAGVTRLLPMQFAKIASVKISHVSFWRRSFLIGLAGKPRESFRRQRQRDSEAWFVSVAVSVSYFGVCSTRALHSLLPTLTKM